MCVVADIIVVEQVSVLKRTNRIWTNKKKTQQYFTRLPASLPMPPCLPIRYVGISLTPELAASMRVPSSFITRTHVCYSAPSTLCSGAKANIRLAWKGLCCRWQMRMNYQDPDNPVRRYSRTTLDTMLGILRFCLFSGYVLETSGSYVEVDYKILIPLYTMKYTIASRQGNSIVR